MSWQTDLARDLDVACDLVRDQLARQFAPIEEEVRASPERRFSMSLHEDAAGELRAGTKPLSILLDPEGRTYVLKRGDPPLLAAEECAWEMRQLGARPAVPAILATVDVDGVDVQGLLKPYIDLHRGELTPDTTKWTERQRAVLMREHAWEHLLENLDTNTTQYAILGPDDVPVNIDWDRSFAADPGPRLSRFQKYRPILPNARTFLYSDYVEGRIDLPLDLLAREASRIRRMPTDAVRVILGRYARVRFSDEAEANALIERIVHRKQHVEVEVARFIRDLRHERAKLAASVTPRERFERIATHAWDQWQVILHVLARGPLGRAGRRMLKLVRGRRLRAPAALPPPTTTVTVEP